MLCREAAIDKCLDTGLLADAECWRGFGTLPERRQMTLLSKTGTGQGYGGGERCGGYDGDGLGDGCDYGYGNGHGAGDGYAASAIDARGNLYDGGVGCGFGNVCGGGRYPKLCRVRHC